MSQRMLPPDERLSFAERHPILKQIGDDTLKLSKEQVAVPAVMSISGFITSILRGDVTSVRTAALWLAVYFVGGVLLYLLINVLRAPFIVIGRHHQQIADLNRRVADVETKPPTVIEKEAPPVPALPDAPKDEPNLVYVKSETFPAYKNMNGGIYDGPPDRNLREGEEDNLTALIAEYNNQLHPPRKIGDATNVSAHITYRFFDGSPTLEINRGSWLSHTRGVVDFGKRDSQRLIIALWGGRGGLRVSIINRDFSPTAGALDRKHEIKSELASVRVRLIAESDEKLLVESELMLEINREPEFKVELNPARLWKLGRLTEFRIQGYKLIEKFFEIRDEAHKKGEDINDFFNDEILSWLKKQEEEIAEQAKEWVSKAAAFIGQHISDRQKTRLLESRPSIEDGLARKYRLIIRPPNMPPPTTPEPTNWNLMDSIKARIDMLDEFAKELR